MTDDRGQVRGRREKVEHFRDLLVWQKAHTLFLQVCRMVDQFPRKQAARVIADQVLRSASSISANIAEGFASRTGKEYLRYLGIAFRTANETENWLINIRALDYADPVAIEQSTALCVEIRRMLTGLRRSIRAKVE